MPKKPVFIFDMDGTMVASMPFHQESWVIFAERHSLKISVADLMAKTTGRTGHECMEILLEKKLTAEQSLALVAEKESIYRELFAPRFSEVQGFRKFAEIARQAGIQYGVGTAGDQHNAAFVLKHLAMSHPPEIVVRGDEGLAGKPNPDIFLEVARRLGADPSQCIVFEDAPFGIEAAKRGGMRAVAMCTGHTAKELAGPHVMASATHFDELISGGFIERCLTQQAA
jgi:beta-phosphoglucomutase-like phosphatase (HAD superfamily)